MGRVFSVLTVFFIVFYMIFANAQQRKDVAVDPVKRKWVDSVYNKLTDRERIGQLFMVAAYSGGKDYNESQVKQMLDSRQIGGVIFMGGTPEAQARLNNEYQRMAQVPLLVGM